MLISMKRLLAVKALQIAFYVCAFKPTYLYRVYKLFHVSLSLHSCRCFFFLVKKRTSQLGSVAIFPIWTEQFSKEGNSLTAGANMGGEGIFFSSNAVRFL